MNRLFTAQQESVVTISNQLAHLAKLPFGQPSVAMTPEQIATFMETTFWASLRANEGRAVRFSATLASPGHLHNPMAFAESVPYDEEHIAKIAPALPPGGWFGVSMSTDPFTIWGFGQGRLFPRLLTISVDVSAPGILRVGVGPFHPYAILDGRADPVVSHVEKMALPYALKRAMRKPQPLEDDVEQQADWRECLFLGDLARAVLTEGHGGALLIVPDETGGWKASLSMAHRLEQVDTTIHDLIRQNLRSESANTEVSVQVAALGLPPETEELLSQALAYRPGELLSVVRHYATLASVDGAVVVTKDLRVLGFGAKITAESPTGATVCELRPLAGLQEMKRVPIADSGGTRHQSAVRFVLKHPDTLALVISQDRHLSIVYWEQEIDSVVLMRNAEWFE